MRCKACILRNLKEVRMRMKPLRSIFSVLLITCLFGCSKSQDEYSIWMAYPETFCSDPWGWDYNSQSEKKRNILNYLKEVEVLEIKFEKMNVNIPACVMCPCLSGVYVLCRVKKENIGFMEDEGFLPYDTIKRRR